MRFDYLLRSEQPLTVRVQYVDRKSSTYANEDMIVAMDFGSLDINWKPLTFSRFLKFIRYNKFKQDAYK